MYSTITYAVYSDSFSDSGHASGERLVENNEKEGVHVVLEVVAVAVDGDWCRLKVLVVELELREAVSDAGVKCRSGLLPTLRKHS